MSPINANPGAGGARVHGISKSDAASPTRNQVPAQTNPAARSAAVAEFLLSCADAWGVRVGSNGLDVITVATSRVPLEVGRWLHIELNKNAAAVFDIIQQQNAGGRS